jgi:transposase
MDTILNENMPISRHLEFSREAEKAIREAAPQNAAKAEYRKGIDEIKAELLALRESTEAQFKALGEALPGIVEAAVAKQLERLETDLELSEEITGELGQFTPAPVLSELGATPPVAPTVEAPQAPTGAPTEAPVEAN